MKGLQAGNYDKTYYLEPGEGGAKAYALLRRAMEMTGRIAIARVVIRSKESLAAIRVFQNGVLALETMHFPDEVRSPAGLTGIVEPDLRQQEIDMATNLIASLAGDFTPEKFQNEYRAALLELIEAKVTGDEVVQMEAPPERGRVVDLMEALRASIRQAEEQRGAEPAAAAIPPAAVVATPPPGPAAVAAPFPPAGAPPAPAPGFALPLPGLPVAPPGAATGPVPFIPGPVPTAAPPPAPTP